MDIDKSEMVTIGQRLKFIRNLRGLDQPALGKLVGMTKQAINQIESGKTKNPQPANLLKLANVLGVRFDWLCTGDLPMIDHAKWGVEQLSASALQFAFKFDQLSKRDQETLIAILTKFEHDQNEPPEGNNNAAA